MTRRSATEATALPESALCPDAANIDSEVDAGPSQPPHRRRWMVGAAYGALLLLAFGGPLIALTRLAAASELHSHILLVPFISAYLLYVRRDQLRVSLSSSFSPAAVAAIVSALAFGVAWWLSSRHEISRNDYLAAVAFSFVVFVAAGGFAILGSSWMRAAAFPVAFLLFMIPLPDGIAESLETASKVASAEAASWFFNLTGTPFLRDAQIFQLPGITIEVARECSGIRSSWVLLITGVLAANMFLRSTRRRFVLVFCVIPLGILRNGFRILVIGLLCVHIGPEMIHSAIHHHGGPLFFVLSLIPFFGLLWYLRKGEQNRKLPIPRKAEGE